jgi:hypothetical protein
MTNEPSSALRNTFSVNFLDIYAEQATLFGGKNLHFKKGKEW